MSAAVDVIGVVSGIATIWSFAADLFPGLEGSKNKFRFQIGVEGYDPGEDADGYDGALGPVDTIVPSVTIQDSAGNDISGSECDGDDLLISSGGFEDLTCNQDGEAQPVYAHFEALGYEPSCYAYITTTFNDGQQFGFVGNWAKECGAAWYYSGVLIEGSSEYLECMWLKGTGPDTAPNEIDALGITWRFFSGDAPEDPKSLCGTGNGFEGYEGGTQVLPRDASKKKRGAVKGSRSDDRLVVTKQPSHDVAELCAHGNSYGPDMVNLSQGQYGLFCDMDTGLVSPVCGAEITTDCFELASSTHQKRDGIHIVKNITGVINW